MKVYTIQDKVDGGGYTVSYEDLGCIKEDLRAHFECEGKIKDIDFIVERMIGIIKQLPTGHTWQNERYKVTCSEMSEEEYETLPEFDGW